MAKWSLYDLNIWNEALPDGAIKSMGGCVYAINPPGILSWERKYFMSVSYTQNIFKHGLFATKPCSWAILNNDHNSILQQQFMILCPKTGEVLILI